MPKKKRKKLTMTTRRKTIGWRQRELVESTRIARLVLCPSSLLVVALFVLSK